MTVTFSDLSSGLTNIFGGLHSGNGLDRDSIGATVHRIHLTLLRTSIGCGITGSFAGAIARGYVNTGIVRDLATPRVIVGVIHSRLARLVNDRRTHLGASGELPAIVVVYNLRNSNGAARSTGLTGCLGTRNREPVLITYSVCHPTTVRRLGIINTTISAPIFRVNARGPILAIRGTLSRTHSCNCSCVVLSATNHLRVSRRLVNRLGGVARTVRIRGVLLIVSSVINRSTIGVTGTFGSLLRVSNIVLAGLSNSAHNNTTLSIGTIAKGPVVFTNINRGLSRLSRFRPSEVTSHVLNVNSILSLVRGIRDRVSRGGTRRATQGLRRGGFSVGSLLSRFRRVGGVNSLGDIVSVVPKVRGRLHSISVSSHRLLEVRTVVASVAGGRHTGPSVLGTSQHHHVTTNTNIGIRSIGHLMGRCRRVGGVFGRVGSGNAGGGLLEGVNNVPPFNFWRGSFGWVVVVVGL